MEFVKVTEPEEMRQLTGPQIDIIVQQSNVAVVPGLRPVLPELQEALQLIDGGRVHGAPVVFRQILLRRGVIPIDATVPVTVRVLENQPPVPGLAAGSHKHKIMPSGLCTRHGKSRSGLRAGAAAGRIENRHQDLPLPGSPVNPDLPPGSYRKNFRSNQYDARGGSDWTARK